MYKLSVHHAKLINLECVTVTTGNQKWPDNLDMVKTDIAEYSKDGHVENIHWFHDVIYFWLVNRSLCHFWWNFHAGKWGLVCCMETVHKWNTSWCSLCNSLANYCKNKSLWMSQMCKTIWQKFLLTHCLLVLISSYIPW